MQVRRQKEVVTDYKSGHSNILAFLTFYTYTLVIFEVNLNYTNKVTVTNNLLK